MITLRPESPQDLVAIRHVNLLAFGREEEGALVDLLRADGYARLSLVAQHGAQIVGHLLLSDLPIATAHGMVPAVTLAPLAVVPQWQRQGIGSALVRQALETCRQQGHRIVTVLGHPDFYPRFGFSAALAEPIQSPFAGEAWMACELVSGALDGIAGRVTYPPPFHTV